MHRTDVVLEQYGYQRNGICGEGFVQGIVRDREDGRRYFVAAFLRAEVEDDAYPVPHNANRDPAQYPRVDGTRIVVHEIGTPMGPGYLAKNCWRGEQWEDVAAYVAERLEESTLAEPGRWVQTSAFHHARAAYLLGMGS